MSATEVAADLFKAAECATTRGEYALSDRLEALADRRPAEQAVLDAAVAAGEAWVTWEHVCDDPDRYLGEPLGQARDAWLTSMAALVDALRDREGQ